MTNDSPVLTKKGATRTAALSLLLNLHQVMRSLPLGEFQTRPQHTSRSREFPIRARAHFLRLAGADSTLFQQQEKKEYKIGAVCLVLVELPPPLTLWTRRGKSEHNEQLHCMWHMKWKGADVAAHALFFLRRRVLRAAVEHMRACHQPEWIVLYIIYI